MGLSPGAKHDGWRRDKKGDSIHSGHKLVLLQTLWSHLTFRSPPPERGLSPTGWQLAGTAGGANYNANILIVISPLFLSTWKGEGSGEEKTQGDWPGGAGSS